MAPIATLRLSYRQTVGTPSTELVFQTAGADAAIVDARLVLDGVERRTTASNDIFELAYRYPEKCVARAVLRIGDAEYVDADGDGRPEGKDRSPTTYEILAAAFPNAPAAPRPPQPQPLFPIVPELSGAQALLHSFRASCGSLAAVVHELRGHSLLWASVPPNAPPNEVHRHLGGAVYCVFYRGSGRFHRLTPQGFNTVPFTVTDSNAFQMVAIAEHLWYQPINNGTEPLLYFMIHAPAFEQSEMLTLPKSERSADWGFEW